MKNVILIIMLLLAIVIGYIGYQVYQKATQIADNIKTGDRYYSAGDYEDALAYYELANDIALTEQGKSRLNRAEQKLKELEKSPAELGLVKEIKISHQVNYIRFSSDSKYFVAGSKQMKGFEVRRFPGGKVIKSFKAEDKIWDVSFSPDGRHIASGSKKLNIWEVAGGKIYKTIEDGPYKVVLYSPDGKYLFAARGPQGIIFDPSSGQKLTVLDMGAKARSDISCAAFSPDNNTIVTGDKSRAVREWKIATGKEIRSYDTKGSVYSVAFSPDGFYYAAALQKKIAKLWDAATGEEVRTFTGFPVSVSAVNFSPNSKYIVIGDLSKNGSVWDVDTGKKINVLKGFSGAILDACFSPDGNYIVASSADKTAKIWQIGK